MFENLTQKQKIIFIIILFFMICVIAIYIYISLDNYEYCEFGKNEFDNILLSTNDTKNNIESEEHLFILVHVSGCVKKDGVVKLKENSRINDAIAAAGGLNAEADLTNINLAYILEDGEKIYIPKKGEIVENNTVSSNSSSLSSSSKKININKATQAELETIPGIGPSTALRIINYREEHGKFSYIEDIKNVSRNRRRKIRKYERLYKYKIIALKNIFCPKSYIIFSCLFLNFFKLFNIFYIWWICCNLGIAFF